jgi:hypothetical protein
MKFTSPAVLALVANVSAISLADFVPNMALVQITQRN